MNSTPPAIVVSHCPEKIRPMARIKTWQCEISGLTIINKNNNQSFEKHIFDYPPEVIAWLLEIQA